MNQDLKLDVTGQGPDRLSAAAHLEGDSLNLVLTGMAEASDRDALGALLQGVHDRALDFHVRHIRVDLRALRFMTSSCFKDFVVWLGRARALPAESQYIIHFLSNPKIRWHRASLSALCSFAVDVTVIE